MERPLFSTTDLSSELLARQSRLDLAISKASAEVLTDSSRLNALVNPAVVQPIALRRDEGRIELEPSGTGRWLISVHVPYDGDTWLFDARASEFTMNPPTAEVSYDEIIITFDIPESTGREGVKREAAKRVDALEAHLRFQSRDLQLHDASVSSLRQEHVRRRLDELERTRRLQDDLGTGV